MRVCVKRERERERESVCVCMQKLLVVLKIEQLLNRNNLKYVFFPFYKF